MSKCFWCINIPHSALTLFLSSTIAVGLYIYRSKDEKKCISDNAKVLGIQVTRAQGNRKRLHFVRHAEGYHNLYGEANHDEYLREDLEDAILTPKGRSQCAALAEEVQASGAVANAQLLVVSPMNRTLDTALYSFPFLKGKVPWIAVEALREQSGSHPCDRRSALSKLRASHPHVNFSETDTALRRNQGSAAQELSAGFVLDGPLDGCEDDPIYSIYGVEREPQAHVSARAQLFLEWISRRPEDDIVVVTHSAYLRHMLTEPLNAALVDWRRVSSGSEFARFANCEMRSFDVYFNV